MKTYLIREMFYSLQGEGFWSGLPMTFIRFAGCNKECAFCDTVHTPHTLETAIDDFLTVFRLDRSPHICFTGGEPLLQLDGELLVRLQDRGFKIHLETNGSLTIPKINCFFSITISPKDIAVNQNLIHQIATSGIADLKIIVDSKNQANSWCMMEEWGKFNWRRRFLQPCTSTNPNTTQANQQLAVDWVKDKRGVWMLSLQTHKMINIP